MTMARNYKIAFILSDGSDADKTGKSGISCAGHLPHMRQNYRIT
jgi:hypothetical protein